jgi:hypothetical protein
MLADIYVLANSRSAALVERFLDRFLPDRVPTATEYEVPQYTERPLIVFSEATELIRLCESRPEFGHAVYWEHAEVMGEPRAAHVHFLSDGGLVLGLSTARRERPAQDRLLSELREFAGSGVGYITYEEPPASSSAEFQRLAAMAG